MNTQIKNNKYSNDITTKKQDVIPVLGKGKEKYEKIQDKMKRKQEIRKSK